MHIRLVIATAATAAGLLGQTPSVAAGGVLNHFSSVPQGLPNGNIAQGSVFDIYGSNLGPTPLA